MNHIRMLETILYVRDQTISTTFYRKLLRTEPALNVPGMTEFIVSEKLKIGLMPGENIAKILRQLPHPDSGIGIPRCELYFVVDDVNNEFVHALQCDAILVSPIERRDWGDQVCYFSDPDGHIIAFAQKIPR